MFTSTTSSIAVAFLLLGITLTSFVEDALGRSSGHACFELPAERLFYVGQAIPLNLRVRSSEPTGKPPDPVIARGQIYRIDNVPRVEEDASFVFRYVLVANVAGEFMLPAQSWQWGTEAQHTPRLGIHIEPIPAFGRTREFAGGVGRVKGSLKLESTRTEVGDWVFATLTLEGPGALGILRLSDWAADQAARAGLEIDLVEELVSADPPSRFARLRVRSHRSGDFRFPASRMTTFIPGSNRFESLLMHPVTLEVKPRVSLDLSKNDYLPRALARKQFSWRWFAVIIIMVLVISAAVLVRLRLHTLNQGKRGRLEAIERALAALDTLPTHNGLEIAVRLSTVLQAVRARGNPNDSAARVDLGVEDRVRALAERCWWHLYSEPGRQAVQDPQTARALVAEARGLLLELKLSGG